MDFKVFKGKIKALGDSTTHESTKQAPITAYSAIEMADGQRIKKLMVESGLDTKLKDAASTGDDIELHVVLHPEGSTGLIAFKAGDGQIFATDITRGVASKRSWIKAGWIIGALLLPLLGVGLIIWWHTWKLSRVLARYDMVHGYIASLPNAILV